MKISILTLAALACLQAAAPAPVRVVVAKDGSGDYPTVQNAVDHAFDRVLVPTTARLIIEIRPGIYHERVRVPHDRPRVTFLGQDAQSTIITFGVGAKDVGGTFFSATVDINADEFEAQNITFENSYGTGTQAVAISLHSDRAVFRNCRFLGMQDTLYAASGRQYYVDSYIAGHVDFIFGNAAAVFTHCRLTADAGVHDVFLGRPWRNYSRVVYLECWMGDHIRPEGWNNWNKEAAEQSSWFAEYASDGPGANAAARVKWAKPLTAAAARDFSPEIFLRGADGWNPAVGQ
jgi:pectinesterase